MDGDINVIISDGFTGNIALKTAQGTANFIVKELKKTMTNTILGKISALLNFSNLNKFRKRLDPRLYNGAIFLGLDSPVVKSHGGTDFIGFSNSLDVCNRIVKGNLIEKIKRNIQVYMRINLTKKDLVNVIYMQLGFSKHVAENLLNDFLSTIISNIKDEKKLKLSKFGTFIIRKKKSRIGRNPKTRESKVISSRDVVLFKPSKEFKEYINDKND